VLVAMLANDNASVADIATAAGLLLKSGEPDKSKAWRILKRLEQSKLVRKVRGRYELTKEGVKTTKKIDETIGDDS